MIPPAKPCLLADVFHRRAFMCLQGRVYSSVIRQSAPSFFHPRVRQNHRPRTGAREPLTLTQVRPVAKPGKFHQIN